MRRGLAHLSTSLCASSSNELAHVSNRLVSGDEKQTLRQLFSQFMYIFSYLIMSALAFVCSKKLPHLVRILKLMLSTSSNSYFHDILWTCELWLWKVRCDESKRVCVTWDSQPCIMHVLLNKQNKEKSLQYFYCLKRKDDSKKWNNWLAGAMAS